MIGERLDRVPLRVYVDADIYAREQERIFGGPSWSYVGLAAEVPKPGDFKVTWVGQRQVVLVRDEDGGLVVWPNKCAHRGTALCREPLGHAEEFVCPYHQWVYDLRGNLTGVPFRRGVKRQGGMPEDFCMEANGLPALAVAERHGVVFASFDEQVPAFDEYLSEAMIPYFDRVFARGDLSVLGYARQRIPANWKLLFENIKDPYHLVWTFFGYAEDSDEMRTRRLRQANLMGPSGFVSIDDSEVMRLAQLAIEANPDAEALLEMGGRDTDDAEHMATEVAIRAFYAHYRDVMEL